MAREISTPSSPREGRLGQGKGGIDSSSVFVDGDDDTEPISLSASEKCLIPIPISDPRFSR